MTNLFEIPTPTLAIIGAAERYPVNRIYCVARNYAAHAREMGGSPERETPFFFSKPANALTENNASIPFPLNTQDLHHEVELVVALAGEALASKGEHLSVDEASAAVFAYGVGIDFTRRDLQAIAKEKGRPWDAAKGFDHSAPVSALTRADQISDITAANISLQVNGELRQQGLISDLIWNIPELIAQLSHYYCLRPGDLIFTGTPAGVSAVVAGDKMEGTIDQLETLRISLIARP
jgi:fumarylpyruvate hydrolase